VCKPISASLNIAMPPKSNLSSRFPSRDVFFGTSADLPRIVELDMAQIIWNPDQPRKHIDPVRLQELADSITTHGLIHPITVTRTEPDHYMVIAGERRFRAFMLLERASIPAIISEGSTDELALIENIQREDLSPIDEYQAIARLIEKHGYSQGDAATALGKSRVSINEIMSLSGLAVSIMNEARNVNVSKSVLVEIARGKDEIAQLELWNTVQSGVTTVRALRAQKSAPTLEPNPTKTAIRVGQKFVAALDAIPAQEGIKFSHIKLLVREALLLLNNLHESQGENV
jgi:ParB family transcriptional regulator, chromosome partitioning protein